jgi:hypothetical protein
MDLAEHVLVLMQEVTALKSRVLVLETISPAPPPSAPPAHRWTSMVKRALAVLRLWVRFLKSPQGQGLIALVSPAVAWFLKWLLGSS